LACRPAHHVADDRCRAVAQRALGDEVEKPDDHPVVAHGRQRLRLLLAVVLGRELHADGRKERGLEIADNGVELVDLVELAAVVHRQSTVAADTAPQLLLLPQPIAHGVAPGRRPGGRTRQRP
jgi:hypothetical protein